MNQPLTIPKEAGTEHGPDYNRLRKEGLKYIEKLSSALWTDYNAHDPGITTLEMLAYAITDLGYRIAKPVEDILSSPENDPETMHKQFLSAIHALPSAPVTGNDYRELFIRVEGVRNAWLQKSEHRIIANYKDQPPQLRYAKPSDNLKQGKEIDFYLKGIYDILIDFEDPEPEEPAENATEAAIEKYLTELSAFGKKRDDIKNRIRSIFHYFRGLCEDVDEVKEVPEQPIAICAEIELHPAADPEKVYAQIMFDIDQYLSPLINHYSLREMLDSGKTSDEIFEGPVFEFEKLNGFNYKTPFSGKGFIKKEELKNSGLRTEIRLSDLIHVIMDVEGVSLVKDIAYGFCSCKELDSAAVLKSINSDTWLLCVDEGHKPALCRKNSVFRFFKDVIPIETKKSETGEYLKELYAERNRRISEKNIEDLPVPQGKFSSLTDYTSIQAHFPETYGIGYVGLPESASTERKALVRQLQAYLLFYDQILANYFSQLANARHLFEADDSIRQTYFSNIVGDLKEPDAIFKNSSSWIGSNDRIMKEKGLDNYVVRKNRFLDHLLARFAEKFNEYVFLLYSIYGQDADQAIIRHKADFLGDYEKISAFRGAGFDYFNKKPPELEAVNVTGMEKRLSRLLGFNSYIHVGHQKLPYEVYPLDPEDPGTNYTWEISNGYLTILQGTTNNEMEIDAYKELGYASEACRERRFYNLWFSSDNKVSFFVTNRELEKFDNPLSFMHDSKYVEPGNLFNDQRYVVGYHPFCYEIKPEEVPDGPYKKIEDIIFEMMGFFNNQFNWHDLPYDIYPTNREIKNPEYKWVILEKGEKAFECAKNYPDKDTAFDTLGLVSLLGCDRDNYRIVLFPDDHKKASIEILDTNKQRVAINLQDYKINPLEKEQNHFSEAEKAIMHYVAYFRNAFKLEGMWVVENLLLRPLKKTAATDLFMPVCIDPNGYHCKPLDPYSFRIAVILPGYSFRLRNPDFRKYAERMIRLETPAHILPRICFISQFAMMYFQDKHQAWRETIQHTGNYSLKKRNKTLKDFIRCLSEIYTIYEEGQLSDCNDDTVEKNPIVLGRTSLGTL